MYGIYAPYSKSVEVADGQVGLRPNLNLLLAILFLCVRDTCRLMIRKIQFSPEGAKAGPKVQIPKPLEVEASLDKAVGL